MKHVLHVHSTCDGVCGDGIESGETRSKEDNELLVCAWVAHANTKYLPCNKMCPSSNPTQEANQPIYFICSQMLPKTFH